MTVTKELYRFIEGDSGDVYAVTSADSAEDYNGETYLPVAIGRDEVESKGEMNRDNVKITLDIKNPKATKWFQSSLDFPLTLTIFSKNGAETEVEWKGRLTSVSPKPHEYEFTFESIFTSLRRPGIRARYQLTCRHALYGKGCKLNKEDWAVPGTVTNVATAVVTVPEAAGYANGYYTSGIFEDLFGNLRFITKHAGDQITLIRPMYPLIQHVAANGYDGVTCRIFPGCNRSLADCDTFGNLDNYGGFPFIPGKNPFSGSLV